MSRISTSAGVGTRTVGHGPRWRREVASSMSEEAGGRGGVGRELRVAPELCIAASVAFPLQPATPRAIAGLTP